MKQLFAFGLLTIFLSQAAQALTAEQIKLGTFSMATESDWGASFELKTNGVLIVTPWFSSGEGVESPQKKSPISGTWKAVEGGIELTFSKFKDRFKYEDECEGWKGYHCFRYERSLSPEKEKSPLNQKNEDGEKYAFVNGDWKNSAPAKISKKCLDQCTEMAAKGELKKGVDVNTCAKELCK